MMQTLDEWLAWQSTLHTSQIDLGLERMQIVAKRLDILQLPFPIITVAGTNGKGSTVAFTHAILHAQGYRTGVYTSPHIFRYNERIAIAGSAVEDHTICEAFQCIENVRGDITLTPFEFETLAAVLCFIKQQVDIAILEVGLGGRLDAVNLWDADLALITTIAIDHIAWLGDNREIIGQEKAGIMRKNRPVVCGEPHPPASIARSAALCGAHLWQYTQDYSYHIDQNPDKDCWHWHSDQLNYTELPLPSLYGDYQVQNAALVIAGLARLDLMISKQSIMQGLQDVQLIGRLQKLQDRPEILVDVAHNPQAAQQLALYLQKNKIKGKTRAIFSILCDKDVTAVVLNMQQADIDEWHLITLDNPRAIPVEQLKSQLQQLGIKNVYGYDDFKHVLSCVKSNSSHHDRVVIFGSFLVVSGILSVSLD